MSKFIEWRATVSCKGQVVLPIGPRTQLGLVQGSVLRFVANDAGV